MVEKVEKVEKVKSEEISGQKWRNLCPGYIEGLVHEELRGDPDGGCIHGSACSG